MSRQSRTWSGHDRTVAAPMTPLVEVQCGSTTQPVLGELNERGVKFLTLRMRSPALIRHINSLRPADYKTITLARPGPHNKPKVHEDPAVKLTSYPGTVRQLVVTGPGATPPP